MSAEEGDTPDLRGVVPLLVQGGAHSTDGADPLLVAELARRILRPMRERARLLGYALTEHGSRARDIDLVAIPWTEKAVTPHCLANSLRQVLNDLYGVSLEVPPNTDHPKPHGRLCWSYWIRPWTYVDLSIMPPAPAEKGEP